MKKVFAFQTQMAESLPMNNTNSLPQVTESEVLRTEHGVYLTAKSGNVSAIVGITEHGVKVICQNAAHRVWKGSGRRFQTISEAIAAYKKPEMKAIILAADALNS